MSIDKQLGAIASAVDNQEKPITKEEMQEVLKSAQDNQQNSTYRSVTEKPVVVDVMSISDAAAKKLGSMLSDDSSTNRVTDVEKSEQAAPMGTIGKVLKFAKDMFVNVLKLVGKAVGWVLSTLTDVLSKLTDWVLQKIKLGALLAIGQSATNMGGGFRKLRLVSSAFKLAGVATTASMFHQILAGADEFKSGLNSIKDTASGIFSDPESMISSGMASEPDYSMLGGNTSSSVTSDNLGGEPTTSSSDSDPVDDLESVLPSTAMDSTTPETYTDDSPLAQAIQSDGPLQLNPNLSQEDIDYNNITTPEQDTILDNYDKAGVDQLNRIGGLEIPTTGDVNINLEIPKNNPSFDSQQPQSSKSPPSASRAASMGSSPVSSSKPTTSASGKSSPSVKSTPSGKSTPTGSVMSSTGGVKTTPSKSSITPSESDVSITPSKTQSTQSKPSIPDWFYEENTKIEQQINNNPGIFKDVESSSPILTSLNNKLNFKPSIKPETSQTSPKSPLVASTGTSTSSLPPAVTSNTISSSAPSASMSNISPTISTPVRAIKPPSTPSDNSSSLRETLRLARASIDTANERTTALKESLDKKTPMNVTQKTTVENKSNTPFINSTKKHRKLITTGM